MPLEAAIISVQTEDQHQCSVIDDQGKVETTQEADEDQPVCISMDPLFGGGITFFEQDFTPASNPRAESPEEVPNETAALQPISLPSISAPVAQPKAILPQQPDAKLGVQRGIYFSVTPISATPTATQLDFPAGLLESQQLFATIESDFEWQDQWQIELDLEQPSNVAQDNGLFDSPSDSQRTRFRATDSFFEASVEQQPLDRPANSAADLAPSPVELLDSQELNVDAFDKQSDGPPQKMEFAAPVLPPAPIKNSSEFGREDETTEDDSKVRVVTVVGASALIIGPVCYRRNCKFYNS